MCCTPALAQAPAEVRVGTSGTANTVLALWMAEDAGLYAAQNLKVTISNMGGGSRGAAEVRAGKLDVMHVGLSSVVQLNQKGADLRTIASLANMIRFGFFTVPAVTNAAGLKGGTVAISAAGSESDAVATIALERLKLSRNDVVLREFGDSLKRLEALKAGEIKATMLNEPFATAARDLGLKPIVDLAAEKNPVAVLDPGGEPEIPRRRTATWWRASCARPPRATISRSPIPPAPSRCWPRARGCPIPRSSTSPTPTSPR